MDVFGIAVQAGGEFLRDAAVDAAYELGVFARLTQGAATADELADAAGIDRGRRRLRALLDVLAATAAIARPEPGVARFAAATTTPPRPVVARSGWGLMAEVIRRDRPLHPEGGEIELRFHRHLTQVGAAAARELAPWLGGGSLLDLGAGAGTYSAAFLDAFPDATATLVDFHDVLPLAAEHLARFGDRVRLIAGDAQIAADAGPPGGAAGAGYRAVLLSNLLHLHSPAMCARLCAAAARAVAADGVVVIKDLRVDEDRRGPLEGLLFALNMAIYTGEGDVYPVSQLRAWLVQAGLTDIEEHRLAAAPDGVVVLARPGRS